ncbi:probable protein phosphatase 2C 56 isoform X1 [Hordeum vulgare subsp. vulgare]|uniref:protein-serine/threonine phosphatase n=1 Tax=Hordeum vulgare subsp. vulgare TaxID=112509 RepID=A0A8I6YI68_HORVV|nr:probable protein phosphatase 2C 56 isoform X1 [Hordeum vulgare subsp. vulgare]
MARAAAANLRGLVGIAAAGRRRVTASVATPRGSPGGRGFRAVASGSGGRTTPESPSSSSPALPQLQPRRGLATRRAVLRNLISGGLESEDGKLSCGYSSFKGRRPTMEDRYDVKFAKMKGQSISLFGVFDGHAGALAAEYLKEHLLDNLIEHPQFLKNTKLALKTTFLKTDADFLESVTTPYREDGSTALAAVLVGDQIYVANVGDSRAIALKGGKAIPLSDDHKPHMFVPVFVAIPLSDDHKPNLKNERTRIENAGGGVSYDGFTWRVDGILAMSRAFGNRSLKNYVIAEPDIQETQVSSDLEYLVLATDGLWDVVQNEDVISLMRATDEPEAAAVKLTEMAHSRHSSDNITCIVVRFHH